MFSDDDYNSSHRLTLPLPDALGDKSLRGVKVVARSGVPRVWSQAPQERSLSMKMAFVMTPFAREF